MTWTLYEPCAALAGLSRYLVGRDPSDPARAPVLPLFSRIGVKDRLAPAVAREAGLPLEPPSRLVWVEPDERCARVLEGVTDRESALGAAERFREIGEERRDPLWLWEGIRDAGPAGLAETVLLLAWSWKGDGRDFADQKPRRGLGNSHGVVQRERVRMTTLAARLEALARAPWPEVVLVRATAGEALRRGLLPEPCPGDHANMDRPYAGATDYGNGHAMPDAELFSVCMWFLERGAGCSVHEGRPMAAELARETGGEWRDVDLSRKRPGTDPRFRRRCGEWLMVSGSPDCEW